MSGSGGGGGGGYYEPELKCETISFTTDINSPQHDAIPGLKPQDILDITLDNNIVVVVRRDNGKFLGSINWTNILKLIECLNDGYRYVAVIKQIQDGLIKVTVSAQRSS